MVHRFAGKYEGLVSESVPQVSYAFPSNSFRDDLAYAAAWLHKATGDSLYIIIAEYLYPKNCTEAHIKMASCLVEGVQGTFMFSTCTCVIS